MKTFCITTLGCKVNQYESEQLASVLRARGLIAVDDPATADLRVVNTCSVTVDAASKSRQTVRRMVRLPVLAGAAVASEGQLEIEPQTGQRVIVTGCWATSNKADAQNLPGVSAVIGHHEDVADELNQLLDGWEGSGEQNGASLRPPSRTSTLATSGHPERTRERSGYEVQGQMLRVYAQHDGTVGSPAVSREREIRPGTTGLPLLWEHQSDRQRALLKIQDGCDAHCTYCIIPSLRPKLWSKPVGQVVEEARRLVGAGHHEIVLTGIFLSAFGQTTALHRRQSKGERSPLAELIDALCTQVHGLRRLRLSSLEPGDLTEDLLAALRSHEQVTPHFHLPLQSGSDLLLRRMNRQYTREDFLRMVEQVRGAFHRPALTTDIIAGFPGETDEEFARTLEVVDRSGFIHIHAFPYSPRPGTAAARWVGDFVRGTVVNERIEILRQRAAEASLAYRMSFVGQEMTAMVEHWPQAQGGQQRGRTERYFTIHFESDGVSVGDCVRVRIERVSPNRTHATLVERSRA